MKAGEAIAEILKREGVEIIFGYPVNHILELAARAGIRPIIVRQERIGLHMADAMSRLTSGRKIGVFAMQHGPGAENAFGGVAQAYGEAVPILVLPMGYPRRIAHVKPNYNSVLNMQHVTKSAEPVTAGAEVPNILRRAFTQLKTGRGGPVLVEVPVDVFDEEVPEPLAYTPATLPRIGPDPEAVGAVAKRLVDAKRLVIYAGQGVHYARAWPELKRLAELLAAPVTTSLGGKSAFPENHKLALGSGGNAIPATGRSLPQERGPDLRHRLQLHQDQLRRRHAGRQGDRPRHPRPDGPQQGRAVRARADRRCQARPRGAAGASRAAWSAAPRDPSAVADEIKAVREPWLAEWRPKLTSDEVPLNPYRVIWSSRTRSTSTTRSSPTMPAARATRSRRSGSRRCRSATSAGARPRSSATASGSRWAPSWSTRTSSASTSGAMPRSASPAWTSRPRSASGSRSSRSCSTTSRWRSSSRSCRSRPRSTAHRHLRQLRGHGARVRRLRRADHRARRDRAGDQARHRRDPARPAGAARVHHLQGGRGLQVQVARCDRRARHGQGSERPYIDVRFEDLLRLAYAFGFELARTRGSHRFWSMARAGAHAEPSAR